jgi:hypothetical protein
METAYDKLCSVWINRLIRFEPYNHHPIIPNNFEMKKNERNKTLKPYLGFPGSSLNNQELHE